MSRLDKLLGKGKEVDLGGEIILIKPLKIKDIDLFMSLSDDAKRVESIKKIIEKTLKESVPDATDEELDGISVEYVMTLLPEILEINGLSKEDIPKPISERYNVGSKTKA